MCWFLHATRRHHDLDDFGFKVEQGLPGANNNWM